jgi:hypothetical protein
VERQFEPALYGIALLAGITAARLTERSTLRPLWSALLLGLCLAEPITESVLHRAHGLCFYNQSVGGVRGAHEIGLETTYWFETITDSDWHALLDDLPPNTTVFLRPDHPGLEDLRRWGIWREDLRSVGPEAAVYILYAKRSAYFLRDNQTGQWVPTDLGFRAEQGRADREHRFQGVRLWSRQPGR